MSVNWIVKVARAELSFLSARQGIILDLRSVLLSRKSRVCVSLGDAWKNIYEFLG